MTALPDGSSDQFSALLGTVRGVGADVHSARERAELIDGICAAARRVASDDIADDGERLTLSLTAWAQDASGALTCAERARVLSAWPPARAPEPVEEDDEEEDEFISATVTPASPASPVVTAPWRRLPRRPLLTGLVFAAVTAAFHAVPAVYADSHAWLSVPAFFVALLVFVAGLTHIFHHVQTRRLMLLAGAAWCAVAAQGIVHNVLVVNRADTRLAAHALALVQSGERTLRARYGRDSAATSDLRKVSPELDRTLRNHDYQLTFTNTGTLLSRQGARVQVTYTSGYGYGARSGPLTP